MQGHHRSPGNRNPFTGVLLLATLALAALGLTQCRAVDDNVVGVDVERATALNGRHGGQGSACLRACNAAFRKALRDEERRHRQALRDCERKGRGKGDDDDDKSLNGHEGGRDSERKACRRAEEKTHKANVKKLETARRECKRGCYDEGSGRGGR